MDWCLRFGSGFTFCVSIIIFSKKKIFIFFFGYSYTILALGINLFSCRLIINIYNLNIVSNSLSIWKHFGFQSIFLLIIVILNNFTFSRQSEFSKLLFINILESIKAYSFRFVW